MDGGQKKLVNERRNPPRSKCSLSEPLETLRTEELRRNENLAQQFLQQISQRAEVIASMFFGSDGSVIAHNFPDEIDAIKLAECSQSISNEDFVVSNQLGKFIYLTFYVMGCNSITIADLGDGKIATLAKHDPKCYFALMRHISLLLFTNGVEGDHRCFNPRFRVDTPSGTD